MDRQNSCTTAAPLTHVARQECRGPSHPPTEAHFRMFIIPAHSAGRTIPSPIHAVLSIAAHGDVQSAIQLSDVYSSVAPQW